MTAVGILFVLAACCLIVGGWQVLTAADRQLAHEPAGPLTAAILLCWSGIAGQLIAGAGLAILLLL